jgi:hypothetical protein
MNENYDKVSFYIVPHADDWQLFMQPNAYNDLINPVIKTVFVITTAGDAGSEENYWRAREEGIKSSIRFCIAPLICLQESQSATVFNNHSIRYWSCENVSCYFMCLPDGGLDGKGFSANFYESLTKCKEDSLSSINTVDNSTTYLDWKDFYKTLEAIILTEKEGFPDALINYLNPDNNKNPGDHADHIATGQAIQAMPVISEIPQLLFTGYSSQHNGQHLNETDFFWKTAMLAAYEKAVFDCCGYSTLKEDINTYMAWCRAAASFTTVSALHTV